MYFDDRAQETKQRKFVGYLIGISLFALPVSHMFYTMWVSGAYNFFNSALDLTFIPAGESSIQVIVMLGSGLYLSWLLLFANDWRKRYQGYLLITGTVIVVAALGVLGIGIPNINLTSPYNLGALVLGSLLGLLAELRGEGDMLKIQFSDSDSSWGNWVVNESNRDRPAEFPLAFRGLVVYISVVMAAAVLLNFIYTSNFQLAVIHLATSAALLYFLYAFLDLDIQIGEDSQGGSSNFVEFDQNESEEESVRFEVLGPQQSGKTYLALGLHLTLARTDNYSISGVAGKMPDILEEHDQRLGGKESGLAEWGISGTLIDGAERIAIDFSKTDTIRGKTFTGSVNMFDYPGEVLEDLSDELESRRSKKVTDGGQRDSSPPVEDEQDANLENEDSLGTLDDVAEGVQHDNQQQDEVGDEPAPTGTDGTETDSTGDREKVMQALVKNVGEADTLILLLDTQRFTAPGDIIKNDPGMMLKEMTRIVESADPDETILVATKADYLMDGLKGISRSEPLTDDEYERFRNYVNEEFENGNILANTLVDLADYPVFPVHYLTGEDEDGETKLLIKDGGVRPVGYEELLTSLIES
jgi:hypothetical protein